MQGGLWSPGVTSYPLPPPGWICLGKRVFFSTLGAEAAQSSMQKTLSLASVQFSGTLPEAIDDNNNNIAIIKEICIDRNCFPD